MGSAADWVQMGANVAIVIAFLGYLKARDDRFQKVHSEAIGALRQVEEQLQNLATTVASYIGTTWERARMQERKDGEQ